MLLRGYFLKNVVTKNSGPHTNLFVKTKKFQTDTTISNKLLATNIRYDSILYTGVSVLVQKLLASKRKNKRINSTENERIHISVDTNSIQTTIHVHKNEPPIRSKYCQRKPPGTGQ